MKMKLLQDDPTPNLERILSFVRRYRAVQGHNISEQQVSINTADSFHVTMQPDKLSELIDMVKEMAVKQRHLKPLHQQLLTQRPKSIGTFRFTTQ